MFARDGIVIHQGIHVARRNHEPQTRLPEHRNALRVLPIGLRNHAHLVAVRLQHARDNGRAKRRMVHVRVAADIREIDLVPAAFSHFFSRCGQKRVSGSVHRGAYAKPFLFENNLLIQNEVPQHNACHGAHFRHQRIYALRRQKRNDHRAKRGVEREQQQIQHQAAQRV